MLHPSLSVPFHTGHWVPQWNISLHSIIIMNGLCSVDVSLMEFTESLLLLSFLLLHRRAANPIYFHSYPSNTRFYLVPSIFINLPASSIPSFIWFGHFGRNLYLFIFFSLKDIWLQILKTKPPKIYPGKRFPGFFYGYLNIFLNLVSIIIFYLYVMYLISTTSLGAIQQLCHESYFFRFCRHLLRNMIIPRVWYWDYSRY